MNASGHARVRAPRCVPGRAWIWLAVAALAVACVARAEAGIESASALTQPVLQFLAGHPASDALDAGGARHAYAARRHDAPMGGAWQAVLPVQFVGLVAPLSLIPARSTVSLGRTPAPPALPFLFQRPPPSLLV